MRRGRRRRGRGRSGWNALAVLAAAIVVFPVYWMFNTAFKDPGRVTSLVPEFVPLPPSVENFASAVDDPNFWAYARNSLVASLVTVLLAMLVSLAASIAVVRHRFVGRRVFVIVLVLVQMIPGAAMVIPLYLMLRSIGALDFVPGLILTYMSFVLPFTIWTLRGFVEGIPVELEEASAIDGCSRIRTFWHVQLPLLAPGIVATSIFAFINAWDDYLFAYVLLRSPENHTLPVWLVSFRTSEGVDYGSTVAASVVFSLPVLVFFLFVQRRLVSGMTAGAVKG